MAKEAFKRTKSSINSIPNSNEYVKSPMFKEMFIEAILIVSGNQH